MYLDYILFLVLFISAVTFYAMYHKKSGLKALQEWANKNGYKIIKSEYRWSRVGPYFWSAGSRSYRIFLVTLETSDGKIKKGWVRLGGFILGLLSDKVEVKWEE